MLRKSRTHIISPFLCVRNGSVQCGVGLDLPFFAFSQIEQRFYKFESGSQQRFTQMPTFTTVRGAKKIVVFVVTFPLTDKEVVFYIIILIDRGHQPLKVPLNLNSLLRDVA